MHFPEKALHHLSVTTGFIFFASAGVMLLACSIKIKARKHQDVPCCATVLFLGKSSLANM